MRIGVQKRTTTTYVCSDGQVFDTPAEARRHDLLRALDKTGVGFCSANRIVDIMMENRELFIDLLGDGVWYPYVIDRTIH